MQRTIRIIGLLLAGLLCCLIGMISTFLLQERSLTALIQEPSRTATAILQAPTPTAEPTSANVPVVLPEARTLLEAEQSWFKELYSKASPSVVNITSRSYSYDFFFNVVPQEGTGSGFVWDTDGHIVTNYHVIEGTQELEVKFADGTQRSATIVGIDPANDLGVIRLTNEEALASPLIPLPLGETSALAVGQRVVAIGNPFGFEQTLTSGIVSALGRVIQSETGDFIGEVIQHDAAINPGNSGGPLLDINGQVIGVNTQIVSPSGASAGIGFAIPAHTIARVVPELITHGRYPHPWLGFQGFDITAGFAKRLRDNNLPIDGDEGILVVGIYRNSPAEGTLRGGSQRIQAGNLLLPIGGDLIVALDEEPILSQRAMMLYLESKKRVGDSVYISFWREGQLQEAVLTLSERPARQ